MGALMLQTLVKVECMAMSAADGGIQYNSLT